MSKFKDYFSQKFGVYSLAAVVGVVTYFILFHLVDIFSWLKYAINLMAPIIIGIIFAYLIDLVVVFFEKKVFHRVKKPKVRGVLSMTVSIILIVTVIALFSWFVMPELVRSIYKFITEAKGYSAIIEENLKKLDEFAANYGITLGASTWPDSMYSGFDKWMSEITSNLSSTMSTIMGVGAVLANIIIGAILAVYFLIGKRKLFAGVAKFRHSLLTEDQYKRHTAFIKRSLNIFSRYISYTLLEAIGVGFVNAIFMLIAGMPNVTLISVVVGVTNLLPTFGPIAGGAIGAFLLFVEEPFYALIFIIFTFILQLIDGYIVKPKLFSDSMGLPSVLTLISIIIGGKLFGMVGILLSIPFAAVLSILYIESFLPWLVKRKKQIKLDKENAAK